jgi:hypothetical protein
VCYVSNLVIKFQIHSKYSTWFENEVIIHESVGGVGEITGEVHMSLTCSVCNVENVQPKFGSNLSSKNDVVQLVTIEVQAQQWKPHNKISICRDFFVINDSLRIDFENLKLLQCIIYEFK